MGGAGRGINPWEFAVLPVAVSHFAYNAGAEAMGGTPYNTPGSLGANDAKAGEGAGAMALRAPVVAPAPSGDGNDAESRRRAGAAADYAPTSAASLLTEEADPGGIKRHRLLGE